MDKLINFIKKTDKEILDIDELILIIDYIKHVQITNNNLHLILKLITNLLTYYEYIDFDIDNILLKNSDILLDGDVISFVKIYCSIKYNNPEKAINLINKYNVHKTSSYEPVYNFLIKIDNYILIKKLFYQYVEQNNLIIKSNTEIKEQNHNIRLYNENIKLFKQKQQELNNLATKINININIINLNEQKSISEQHLIILDNQIIINILELAINIDDYNFIQFIIKNLTQIQRENSFIINLLLNYYNSKQCIRTSSISNRCVNCSNNISCQIINNTTKQTIINLIKSKLLNITHRTDNGQLINDKEKKEIIASIKILDKLLIDYDFNIVIDGANLGYFNSAKTGEININFMRKIINELLLNNKDKYILLILHSKHQLKIKQLNINNRFLKIYFTPPNINDDLFWLYSTLYASAYILTNDQSRDNSCMISYQTEIKQYLNYYQIKLNVDINFNQTLDKYNIIDNLIIYNSNNNLDSLHIKQNNELFCIC